MPKRKQVKTLQRQCLYSIIVNLDRHCRNYRDMCEEGDGTNTSYKFFHRLYSDNMLDMLRDAVTVPKAVCPTSGNDIRFKFQNESKLPEEDYLAFILNRYSKHLNLSKDIEFSLLRELVRTEVPKPGQVIYIPIERRQIPITRSLTYTVAGTAKNLTVVELQNSGVCLRDLDFILKHIPQVLRLNVSDTCFCDDHLPLIRTYCSQLEEFDMSRTRVTDVGVEYLCASNSEGTNSCKISDLDIGGTYITYGGTRMILECLLHLEKLRYYDINEELSKMEMKYRWFIEKGKYNTSIPISLIYGGMLRILYDINESAISRKDFVNVRKCNIKEISFGIYENKKQILQLAPLLFPEVRSVKISHKIPSKFYLLCTAFHHFANLHLHLKDPIPSHCIQKLLTVRGSKIEILHLTCHEFLIHPDYNDMLRWLELCPKLKKLLLVGLHMKDTEFYQSTAKPFNTPLTSLSRIELCNLQGSALKQFLPLLLSSASHVTELIFMHMSEGVTEALEEAFRLHSFSHLRSLNIICTEVNLDTLYRMLKIRNLKSLGYSFTWNNQSEAYEKMCEMMKRENMDIEITDEFIYKYKM